MIRLMKIKSNTVQLSAVERGHTHKHTHTHRDTHTHTHKETDFQTNMFLPLELIFFKD